MADLQPALSAWRTARRSGGENCVEVGLGTGLVGIRDTKNRDGGTLVIDQRTFAAFIQKIAATRKQE